MGGKLRADKTRGWALEGPGPSNKRVGKFTEEARTKWRSLIAMVGNIDISYFVMLFVL
jgi:hypothetical protein